MTFSFIRMLVDNFQNAQGAKSMSTPRQNSWHSILLIESFFTSVAGDHNCFSEAKFLVFFAGTTGLMGASETCIRLITKQTIFCHILPLFQQLFENHLIRLFVLDIKIAKWFPHFFSRFNLIDWLLMNILFVTFVADPLRAYLVRFLTTF